MMKVAMMISTVGSMPTMVTGYVHTDAGKAGANPDRSVKPRRESVSETSGVRRMRSVSVANTVVMESVRKAVVWAMPMIVLEMRMASHGHVILRLIPA